MGYARPSFREFESYFRMLVASDEKYIQLNLKQYSSKFITLEIPPVTY